MKMKASDALASVLSQYGVRTVFGYQGGSITHIVDSLARSKGIRYVQCYNEQGASLAADAYGRVAEEGIGVALATNGPGATNLITGIADAYCDSVPVLFITGQVHTFAMKGTKKVRQESFQEIDILPIVRPITKFAACIMNAEELVPTVRLAIKIAKEGRKGPVLIDIPVDVQAQCVEMSAFPRMPDSDILPMDDRIEEFFNVFSRLLDGADKPLILAGGGIQQAGVKRELELFSKKIEAPVVVSLQGLDSFPHHDPRFMGFIGVYGNRYANIALQESDLLIVLGSRIDGRRTGKNLQSFAENASIVHVDIDDNELSNRVHEDLSLCCDLRDFFHASESLLKTRRKTNTDWMEVVKKRKNRFDDVGEYVFDTNVNPNKLMRLLGGCIDQRAIVSLDVGQNQLWAAQSLRISIADIRILSSGGLGCMGFALPASIGAYFADPDALIIGIMGDGGLQMNIQELQLISQYQLPITVVVMNNGSLGLIRDIQEKYYEERYVGSIEGFSVPDLRGISEIYGFRYFRIDSCGAASQSALFEALHSKAPAIVDVCLEGKTYVAPELIGPNSLNKQNPIWEEMG